MAAQVGKKSKKKKSKDKNGVDWRILHEKEQHDKREKLIYTYLQNKLERESSSAKLNSIKLDWSWRQILRELKHEELKEMTSQMKDSFEQLVETKNSIINLLSKEIIESEKRRRHSFERHLDCTDSILKVQQRHIDRLKSDYSAQVHQLMTSFDKAETKVDTIQTQSSKAIKDLEMFCHQNNEELKRFVETEFQNKNDDILNKSCEVNKMLKVGFQSTVECLASQLQQLNTVDRVECDALRKSLETMKSKDENRRRDIYRQHIQAKRLQGLIKQLKQQIHLLKEEELNGYGKHNESKTELSGEVVANRKRMELLKTESERRLSALANSSSAAIEHLQAMLKQAERVQRWKRMCDMPVDEKLKEDEVLEEEEAEEDEGVHEDMITFWRQFNQSYFEKCLLKSHHQTLVYDNLKLKSLVKQYLEHVANICD